MKKLLQRTLSIILTAVIIVTTIQVDGLTLTKSEAATAGTVFNYNYTGGIQTFTAPNPGTYKIELYGASGGGASAAKSEGGTGGYTSGTVKLAAGDKLYLMVGQQGSINGGSTYGGGGAASGGAGSGGGATAVFSVYHNNIQEAKSDQSVLLVAGGGGGRYSTSVPSGWEMRGSPRIGSGGGPQDNALYVVETTEVGAVFGHIACDLSTLGSVGGNGDNGYGAGGGGYTGGTASDTTWCGGAGGTGFVSSEGITDGQSSFSNHIGNGSVKITYQGTYNVTVSVILSNNGSFGVGQPIESIHYITAPCGSTINFPDAVSKDTSYITFGGYETSNGSSIQIDDSSKKAYVGMQDSTVIANWSGSGISIQGSVNTSTKKVHLDWIDTTSDIYYTVYNSIDSNCDTLDDYEALEGATEIKVSDSWHNVDSGYTITTTGWYALYVSGTSGQNSEGSSGDHYGSAGGLGTSNYTQLYLKKGDIAKCTSYSGGQASWYSVFGNTCKPGSGGTGIGIQINSNTVISAGGGGGAGSNWIWDNGDTHFDGYGGAIYFGAASGLGTRGHDPVKRGDNVFEVDGSTYAEFYEGAGGGGYPNGGAAGSAGQSWVTSSINGKASRNTSTSYGVSNTLTARLTLVGIMCGTLDTFGDYNLYDKKAPYTPKATSNGGYEGSNSGYKISWEPTEDRGSNNTFMVVSYRMSDQAEVHKSKNYSVMYTSGLKEYRYITSTSPSITPSATTGTSVGTNTSVDISLLSNSATTYVHIWAVDKSGNISGVLTIPLAEKVVIFNPNNTTYQSTNRYGDTFSTEPSVVTNIDSQIVRDEPDTYVMVPVNNGQYTRTGYRHYVDSTGYVWNTKPDGTGTTYHSGDKIDFTTFSGKQLVLYAIWEPNTYTVTWNYNKPSKATSDITNNTRTSNTVRFDSSPGFTLPTPALRGWTLTGWKLQNGISYWTVPSKWTTAKDITVYAQWRENTYTIQYDKGKTDYTGTIPSDTSAKYDNDVTMSSKGSMTGRSYIVKFNTNTNHANDQGKNNGTATTSVPSTASRVVGVPDITGNLKFRAWEIVSADSIAEHVGEEFKESTKYTKPNFTSKDEGIVKAKARWDSLVLSLDDTLQKPSLPGYQFDGWFTAETGGTNIDGLSIDEATTKFDKIYYAHWHPNTYHIVFNGNGNWNSNASWDDNTAYKGKYNQTLTFDCKDTLIANQFTRPNNSTASSSWNAGGYTLKEGYYFIGWDKNKNRRDGSAEFTNKQTKIFNLTETYEGNVNYYAIWGKDLTLTFDYNGGMNNGNSSATVLEYTLYNAEYEHTYDISSFYGTYDSNGINYQFTKIDLDGQVYRFLGWNHNKNATEPEIQFCTYNGSKKLTYTIHDDDVLYAIWEPILLVNTELNRSLGNLQFKDGSNPVTSINNVTAVSTNPYMTTIIKPGEQGEYNIFTYSTTGDTAVKVVFDDRICDIYQHNGTWTDELNPNTPEDLVNDGSQKHGLNRSFTISNIATTRKFHIPEYLGTNQSYATSKPGEATQPVNRYEMLIHLEKPSYYWKYVHGTNENIDIACLIYITNDASDGSTPAQSILDELRTRLRTRII